MSVSTCARRPVAERLLQGRTVVSSFCSKTQGTSGNRNTIKSDIFARVSFSRNFAEMTQSQNSKTPPFTESDVAISCFNIANLSFNESLQ